MNFNQVQAEVGAWSEMNFGDQPSYKLLLGVVEEVGELSHCVLKQSQGIRMTEDHKEGIVDAVGDIVIYLMDFCCRENLSLESCVDHTWTQVRKRNWKTNPDTGAPNAYVGPDM